MSVETKEPDTSKEVKARPEAETKVKPKADKVKVAAPNGLRTSGFIQLGVCDSNSRPNQKAVLVGANTSIGMPVDTKTRYWNFNGQTPEDIDERYPQLAKQMLIRRPQGNGHPDKLLFNDEFFNANWNLVISHHGLKLNLAIERDRFWASILPICDEIAPSVRATNNLQKFYIVDTEGEASAKIGKGKQQHDARVLLYAMGNEKTERLAVLYGVDPVGSTKDEQFAALQDGIDKDPAKFLAYVENIELTEHLIDTKLFVLNSLVSIDEFNSYKLEGTFLGTTEEEVALWFMKPANQARYLNLKMALKAKLLKEA
jgi:hypothetical protein